MNNKFNEVTAIYYNEGLAKLFRKILLFTKNRVQKFICKHPITIRTKYELQKRYLNFKYGDAAPDAYNLIRVDPNEVNYVLRPSLKSRLGLCKWYGTHVVDGNWDNPSIQNNGLFQFDEYDLYKFAKDQHSSKSINEWDSSKHTYKELHTFYEKISNLIDSIEQEGYKRQREFGKYGPSNLYPVPAEYHAVRLNIGREGQFIFEDGKHRMIAAKILGLNTIPVRIYARHKQWQKLRQKVANNGPNYLNQISKVDVDHPDIKCIIDSQSPYN